MRIKLVRPDFYMKDKVFFFLKDDKMILFTIEEDRRYIYGSNGKKSIL